MKTFAAFLQTVLFTLIASAAYSQSLADLANKEQERRQEIQDDRVITDEEAAKFRSESQNRPEASAVKPEAGKEKEKELPASKTAKNGEKTDPDEPVDFQGRPESYWRKTLAEARQRVSDLEKESQTIVLKINDLNNQFYREDDGFKREGVQREIQKSLYEQDRNKEELAKAADILQDLEKEARKSGALPGWLR